TRWRGLAVLVLLNAVAPMVMVGLALSEHAIGAALHLDLRSEVLLLEGFVMAVLIVTLLSGPLTARFGIARLLGGSVFGASSILLLLAIHAVWLHDPTSPELAALTFLLGAFVAPLSPATQVLAAGMAPEAGRARRLMLWTGARTGGMIAGALAAGALLAHHDWGTVFLLPLVLLLPALPLLRGLPRTDAPASAFDVRGLGLLLAWLVPLAVILAFADGWPGWGIAQGIAATVVIGLMLALFVRHGLHADAPLLRLDVLWLPGVALALLLVFLLNLATTGQYEVLFVQDVLGWPSTAVSWFALAYAFGQLAGVGASSLLTRRVGDAVLVGIGLLILIAGMIGYTRLNPAVGTLATVTPHVLTGFGSGLVLPLLSVIAFRRTPESRRGDVSSLVVFTYILGTELGLDGLGAVYGHFVPMSQMAGFHAVFVTELGIATLCLLIASTMLLRQRVLPARNGA
ncbi:MAG: MFS transporter, partial [Chromatiales bacterium]|nr:MFS transporter [Chromatiales bacterium]